LVGHVSVVVAVVVVAWPHKRHARVELNDDHGFAVRAVIANLGLGVPSWIDLP
jgi:hypothetical protein